MAKITLTDTAGGYGSAATINANNDLIEAAVENQLSRDGTTPNSMNAELDMNSNRVSNMADGVNQQDAITLAQAGVIAGLENPLTQDSVAAVLWPQTALESANGVTPTELQYPEGNVFRYGAVADSSSGVGGTDNTTAFQNAVDSGHCVFVPPGRYSIEGTVEIIGTSAEDGGKTFIMCADTRLERYGVATTPILHVVGAQMLVDGNSGTLAARAGGGFTSGLLLLGQDPNGTYGDSTSYDLTNSTIRNFKVIGASANTGWEGSVGVYCESSARRRGQFVSGGNINSYYNTIENIASTQWDYPFFISTDFNANTFMGCTAHTWGHAGYWINGYANQFEGCKIEAPTAQDTTERFGFKLGAKDSGPEAVNAMCDEDATSVVVTGISSTNPAVVTVSTVHGIATTDTVRLYDIVDNGPNGDLETELNLGNFTATQTSTTTFSIPVDGTLWANTYVSGGVCRLDTYPIVGARANQISAFAEIQYDASTKVTRLMSQTRPPGAKSTEKLFRNTFGKNVLNVTGTVSGGVGNDGFSTEPSVLNNIINYTQGVMDYDRPHNFHGFGFRRLDDETDQTFGSNEFKVLSGRMANLAESTAYNVLTWDNIGATDAAGVLKLTFCGKEDTNSDVHGGEISWLLPVTGAAAQTAIKYKDFQANENDENVTWSITSAAGTNTDTGKFTLVMTTGSTAGTGNFYYTWKVELVTSQLEGTNIDWDGDITVTNGGV